MFAKYWFCKSSRILKVDSGAQSCGWSCVWKHLKGHLKLITWTLLLVTLLHYSTAKIVLGVEKVCSTKIIVGQKHLHHLSTLAECDVIEGSLTVAYVDFSKQQPEPFPLREITGSLVIYRVTHLKSLEELFPHLTLIRGLGLFGNYSLVIHENLQLEKIGLVSLVKVLHGSVRITRNPLLCYVHTINWIPILEDLTKQHYVLKHNRNQNHCPSCTVGPTDVTKLKYCWDYKKPQRICPDTCGSGECDVNGQCCEANCLLNCPNATHTNCEVCKYFKTDSDSRTSPPCVKECSMHENSIGNRRCIASLKCKEQGYFSYKNDCVKRCPEGSIQLKDRCEEYESSCIMLTCKGGIIRTTLEARKFIHCAYIDGFLELQLVEKGTNLITELEKSLSNIVTISEFLRVWKSPQLTSLSFFKKLKLIEGKKLIRDKYSVVVSENFHLENIWEKNQTVTISKGAIYFHFNPHLCFDKITEFVKLVRNNSNFTIYNDNISPSTNGRMTVCGPNITELDVKIEKYNATAARTYIKIDPRMFEDERTFFGYIYYYIEVPEGTVSIPEGRHGCGYDSWKSDLDLSKNARHILKNLKPNTKYAYFVKTFAVATSLYPKEGHSKIMYFKTLPSKPGPVSKFFVNPTFETEIILHWWPPTVPNGNISFYLIDATEISKQEGIPMKSLTLGNDTNGPEYENVATEVHNRKLVDTRLNITLNCPCASASNWRGYPLKHNEFYGETEAMYEDELANHVYLNANTTGEVDKNETTPKLAHNETEFDRMMEERLRKAVRRYDTGPNNFPIITRKQGHDNVKLPNTTYRVPGNKHNLKLSNLLPSVRYRVTIAACNEPDLCGPKTALNFTSPYNF